ncbi:hypothetical protein AVENLUH5627_02937 [Acinetobacter venetianus]|uniref:Uncharacterized protein n=1 Tax=Acinetobacter venetianus TaxID=52133 RepID=A0A150HLE2_9GAMM|nr:hypothetical protein [Acinetobacter venetianus]KXZ65106.1 hypothetical protein AVENLUH5627_02937 [Acinetobacter venetianus]
MAFKTTDHLIILNKLDENQKDQLEKLIGELRPLNYERTSQLSTYISKENIGINTYRIIGAELTLSNGYLVNKVGGLPKEIYRYLCNELGLKDDSSDFIVISEKPHRDNLK